jgi:hypothetical protein
MRVWFMLGAMVLGIMGVWGEQGRGARGQRSVDGGDSTVRAMDGGSTVPPPLVPGR